MQRRLASVALVPMKQPHDQLVDLVEGAVILGVSYTGGASVNLLLEVPVPEESPIFCAHAFRRFEIGSDIPDHYTYVGREQVGPTTVFVYERMKP